MFHSLPVDDEETISDCVKQYLTVGRRSNDFLHQILDPHFSLLRGNCVIRHHQIDPIVKSVEEKLSKQQCFTIALKQVKILHNDEGTRSFICFCASDHIPIMLQRVLEAVTNCFAEFIDVKMYADQFIPHVSVIWFLPHASHDPDVEKLVQDLSNQLADQPVLIRVSNVQLKIGNQIFTVSLRNR